MANPFGEGPANDTVLRLCQSEVNVEVQRLKDLESKRPGACEVFPCIFCPSRRFTCRDRLLKQLLDSIKVL